MNRRSILTMAPAAALTVVPVAAAVAEEPHAKMHRLMRELAEVMPLTMNGRFRAVVNPDGSRWLEDIDRRSRGDL